MASKKKVNPVETKRKTKFNVFDGLGDWQRAGKEKSDARVVVFSGSANKKIQTYLKENVFPWQVEKWQQESIAKFVQPDGPIYIIWLKPETQSQGSVKSGIYSQARDDVGAIIASMSSLKSISSIELDISRLSAEAAQGALVGTAMAQYDYHRTDARFQLNLRLGTHKKALVESSRQLARSINLARMLVDMPPNLLHPQTYAEGIKALFSGQANVKVDVWNPERLEKEGMGLHLAVGRGAEKPPCLVHIRYRPSSKKKPIAFVGKGVTFDSGGLDIKPTSGMRLMKKDMGGSATVVGLALYMVEEKIKQPADFYLALAENAVDSRAFRPGDIFTARNGKSIEIHNTDAEGRLVLADAIDVAISQTGDHKPSVLIDVATLTGAIKVGLGADIGGLFSNRDALAQKIQKASYKSGDPFWQMPLYQGHRGKFRSEVADLANAVDGFGGAINASLFLENFVGDIPWAHLDIYAWKDRPQGAYRQRGGSGQAVQCLAEFVTNL